VAEFRLLGRGYFGGNDRSTDVYPPVFIIPNIDAKTIAIISKNIRDTSNDKVLSL